MVEAGQPAMGPSVTYSNTRRDLLLFQWQMVFRSRPNQLLVGFGIPAAGLSALVVVGFTPGGYLAAVVNMALMVPAILALIAVAYLGGMSTRANRAILARHTVTLTARGVVEETAYGRSESYWTAVDRVLESGGYVYIFTTQFSAYMIPAAAFGSLEQRQAFVAYARQCLQQASPSTR
jgi:hypothetical protein